MSYQRSWRRSVLGSRGLRGGGSWRLAANGKQTHTLCRGLEMLKTASRNTIAAQSWEGLMCNSRFLPVVPQEVVQGIVASRLPA